MPVIAFLASCLLSPALQPVTAQAQGNVLLVVADDVGVDKLASFGGIGAPVTPTLDALADDGVRFTRCWANPVCSSTRATIQTGRYSFRTGVGNVVPLSPDLPFAETTLPEALDAASAGAVAHAAFGKWHLGGGTQTALGQLHPNLHGWGHYAGLLAGGFGDAYAYDLWPRTLDGATAITRTYATSANVDDALAWIGAQSDPWLCYLAFNAPHTPLHLPPAGLYTTQPPLVDPCLTPSQHYAAMLEALDSELGRLLDTLAPEVRARTSVIFVGDNGTDPLVSDGALAADRGKGSLYQGGIAVPLIVQGPGIVEPGRAVGALCNTVDLFATALELAGATAPGGTDSVSLVPYLTATDQSPLRAWAFAELFTTPGTAAPSAPGAASAAHELYRGECGFGGVVEAGRAIRNGVFKLVRSSNGSERFFNLVNDPGEQNDLLQGPTLSPPAQANLDALRAQLDALLDS